MRELGFETAVRQILERDARYDPEAYRFVREGLDFTVTRIRKNATGKDRHVNGRELLEGLRAYALREFGPLSRRVLNQWGIYRTEDFGTIVFHLVEQGALGKTDSDSREDFADGYCFHEVFDTPFLPARRTDAPARRREHKSKKGCPGSRVPEKE